MMPCILVSRHHYFGGAYNLSHTEFLRIAMFNVKQFYSLPSQHISVFYKNDDVIKEHNLVDLYKRDDVCFLGGAN